MPDSKSQDDKPQDDNHSEHNEQENKAASVDSKFQQPPPSPWKRLALIILVGTLFYFAFQLRAGLHRKPKVIYASRYSKDHKFRPAASPVITETLKDGRIRLRGATPSPTPAPTPSSTAVKKRRRPGHAGHASGKRKRTPAAARQ